MHYLILLHMLRPLLYLLLRHFPLLFAQLLFLLDLLLQLMQLHLYFLHSPFLRLPLCDSLIVLLPLFLYSHSCFLYKWICLELAAFLFLHVIENLPLAPVTHWYACLRCWCRFSLGCCFTLLH